MSKLENGILNTNINNDTLIRSSYDYDVIPSAGNSPQYVNNEHPNNVFTIDFNYANIENYLICNDGVDRNNEKIGVATWQLGSEELSWCVEPIINENSYPNPDFGGIWWAGSEDAGWGLSISFLNDTVIVITYYYDAEGNPRWVIGSKQGFEVGNDITIDLQEYLGFAREADAVTTVPTLAGTITLNLLGNNNNITNNGMASISINYQGQEGGTWERSNIPITNFTAAH